MKKIYLLLALTVVLFVHSGSAQISTSVMCGFGIPKGETFNFNGNGGGFGLSFSANVLYHLPSFDNKLGLGLTFSESFVFGGGSNDNSVTVGLFVLDLYGVKGEYRFFNRGFSPYVSLATGLSRFEIGGLSMGESDNELGVDGNLGAVNSFSLGLAPEVGLDIGLFRIAATYFVPMKYKAIYGEKKTAGLLEFTMGLRYGFGLN